MADITLDEYFGIPEEELGQILQAEARKMFNSDSFGNDSEEVVNMKKGMSCEDNHNGILES